MKNILIIEHRDEVSSNGGGEYVAGRLWFCFSVKLENRSEGAGWAQWEGVKYLRSSEVIR